MCTLPTFPRGYFAKPLNLNNYEFLIAPEKTQRDASKGLYKYNTKTNEWIVCVEYNKMMESSYHTVAIDISQNILYSYDAQSHLIQINLKSKQIKTSKKLYEMQYIYASSLIINHQFHLIGGQNNNKHLIWNENTQQFDQIHEFKEFKEGFSNHGLIHISSKQMLLLICADFIYSYSMNNNKWLKLDICLPVKMRGFGYVLTRNDQCVIIFDFSGVYILDLYIMEFTKTDLIFNMNQCHAILMYDYVKDQYLTQGYVRQCWNCKSFNNVQYPSNDILKLVQLFCPSIDANIHVFERGSGKHLKFKLSDIIHPYYSGFYNSGFQATLSFKWDL